MRAPIELSSLISNSLMVLALAASLGGCKSKASTRSAAPEPTNADAAAGDPLARLDQLEGEMRAYGLQPTSRGRGAGGDLGEDQLGGAAAPDGEAEPAEADMVDPNDEPMPDGVEAAPAAAVESEQGPRAKQEQHRDEAQQRCESLCSLNEAICELETSICSLAQDHGDDPAYADACERATDDCAISSDACDACDA